MNFEAIITKINRVREMQDMIDLIAEDPTVFMLGEIKITGNNAKVLSAVTVGVLSETISATKSELEALGVTFRDAE